MIVTTSWDDGYPADAKIAELLAKHGAKGTFYVPDRNAEGRPVMTPGEVERLARTFEIGGHSIDHIVLTALDRAELARQITTNKHSLERATGTPLHGFCYVRGRYNAAVKAAVRNAGYTYARTVESFHTKLKADPFDMPVTLQFYPHARATYARNFAKAPHPARAKAFAAALRAPDLEARIAACADACSRTNGILHLWGHSWELEERNLWQLLDDTLGRLARMPNVRFLTNHETVTYAPQL